MHPWWRAEGCAGTYFDVAISAVFFVLFVLTWTFACARLATTVVNHQIRARLRWAQAVFTLAPVVLILVRGALLGVPNSWPTTRRYMRDAELLVIIIAGAHALHAFVFRPVLEAAPVLGRPLYVSTAASHPLEGRLSDSRSTRHLRQVSGVAAATATAVAASASPPVAMGVAAPTGGAAAAAAAGEPPSSGKRPNPFSQVFHRRSKRDAAPSECYPAAPPPAETAAVPSESEVPRSSAAEQEQAPQRTGESSPSLLSRRHAEAAEQAECTPPSSSLLWLGRVSTSATRRPTLTVAVNMSEDGVGATPSPNVSRPTSFSLSRTGSTPRASTPCRAARVQRARRALESSRSLRSASSLTATSTPSESVGSSLRISRLAPRESIEPPSGGCALSTATPCDGSGAPSAAAEAEPEAGQGGAPPPASEGGPRQAQ